MSKKQRSIPREIGAGYMRIVKAQNKAIRKELNNLSKAVRTEVRDYVVEKVKTYWDPNDHPRDPKTGKFVEK